MFRFLDRIINPLSTISNATENLTPVTGKFQMAYVLPTSELPWQRYDFIKLFYMRPDILSLREIILGIYDLTKLWQIKKEHI